LEKEKNVKEREYQKSDRRGKRRKSLGTPGRANKMVSLCQTGGLFQGWDVRIKEEV
jgi:hypothetical protein